MKKNIIVVLATVMLLASCGTYEGAGAANGAYFGSLLGSAIGGINGGYRGSNVGTLVGMAGGAAVGAAIGRAADNRRQQDMDKYYQEKARLKANREARERNSVKNESYVPDYNCSQGEYTDSGFDSSNSGDDRIDIDFGTTPETGYQYQGTTIEAKNMNVPSLEIRNARFIDSDGNNVITRGEKCEIVFEIFNNSDAVAYNVEPAVMEKTGNKHILISPNILVESLSPRKGVRYTARIVADKLLKNGTAEFSVGVLMNGKTASRVVDFTVPTRKK